MTVITVFGGEKNEKTGAACHANENKFLETLRQIGPVGFIE